MEDLKRIRKNLGMTQTHLADALGMSRANLSMVEIGQRSLPHLAFIRLLELHNAAQPESEIPVAEDFPDMQQELALIYQSTQKLWSERNKELAAAQKELTEMKKTYSGISESIRLWRNELKLFEGIDAYTNKIEERIASSEKKRIAFHPIYQRRVQLRINELILLIEQSELELRELENLMK